MEEIMQEGIKPLFNIKKYNLAPFGCYFFGFEDEMSTFIIWAT